MVCTMTLREVDLFDYYNLCILYALQRTGSSLSVKDFLELKGTQYDSSIVYEVGTIFAWARTEDPWIVRYPNKITQDHFILTSRWELFTHVGLVEKADSEETIISELTYQDLHNNDIPSEVPIIQYRSMSVMHDPTYVIFPSQLQIGG